MLSTLMSLCNIPFLCTTYNPRMTSESIMAAYFNL